MNTVPVFYAGGLYGEYRSLPFSGDIPDGAYARGWTGNWYLHCWGNFSPINVSDVPADIKMLCLIMGLPI